MPFTEQQRYQTLTFLNEALLRTDQMRAQYSSHEGEFYRFDASLNPTEYQANRPTPQLFEKNDIWSRLDSIEIESSFLVGHVQQLLEDLQTLERALLTERSSVNSALVKADVLEWDIHSRASGMVSGRDDLIEKLRYQLKLPPSPDSSHGNGILFRS